MGMVVIGLFDRLDDARDVVEELEVNGYARENISLLAADQSAAALTMATRQTAGLDAVDAGDAAVAGAGAGATVGAVGGGAVGLLAGLGAILIPGFGPIIAAGPLVALITGAGIGAAGGAVAGGLIGALTSVGVPEEEAGHYAEGLRRGGTLVTVHTSDDMAAAARDTMARHDVVDIRQRAGTWSRERLEGQDPNAAPFLDDEARAALATPAAAHATTAERPAVASRAPEARFEDFDQDFRADWRERYPAGSPDYAMMTPAYRYGYDIAIDPRYRGRDWIDLEPRARNDWGGRGGLLWEDVEATVRGAWDRTRDR
ncbi:MAG: hypothetical protein IT208_04060 [Chthonomonadales bacterium]|nr:hypothetical protein [Chthonomonadales bacterium]